MIEKFDSYEKASMFVDSKRAEGFHAEIMNESVGFLWGPRTVGDFRVHVSDEPHTMEGSDDLQQPDDDLFSRSIRYLFVVILLVGAGIGIVSAITALGATMELAFGILVVSVISVGGGYLIFRNDFRRQ